MRGDLSRRRPPCRTCLGEADGFPFGMRTSQQLRNIAEHPLISKANYSSRLPPSKPDVYVRFADHPLISNRKYTSALPPSWYTLHLLSRVLPLRPFRHAVRLMDAIVLLQPLPTHQALPFAGRPDQLWRRSSLPTLRVLQ